MSKNTNKISSSNVNTINKNSKSTTIKTDFTAIPMTIENPTKPSLYSFFMGLKNVLTKSGRENN